MGVGVGEGSGKSIDCVGTSGVTFGGGVGGGKGTPLLGTLGVTLTSDELFLGLDDLCDGLGDLVCVAGLEAVAVGR